MKNYKRPLYALLFVGFAVVTAFRPGNSNQDTATLEGLSQDLVSTIQTNNFNAYQKLVITNEEFIAIVMKSELTDEQKGQVKEEIMRQNPYGNAKKDFDELMKYGTEKGIVWSNYKIVGFNIDAETEVGLLLANLRVTLSSGTDEFSLSTRECIKTPKGWRLTRMIKVEAPYDVEDSSEMPSYEEQMPEMDTAAFNAQMRQLMQELNRQMDSINKAAEMDSLKKAGNPKK